MYFYLKEPKSKTETLIYLIHFIKSENKNFKYSTGLRIKPIDWDFVNRFPKLKRGHLGKENKYLRDVLTNYKNELELALKTNNIENEILTKIKLKDHFNKVFKESKSTLNTTKQTNLINLIDFFLTKKQSTNGVSKDWVNKYKNLKNKILLFDLYNKKETTIQDVTPIWIDEYCGFLRKISFLLKDKPYKKKIDSLGLKMKLPKTNYNDNTLHRHIKYLLTFINWTRDNFKNLDIPVIKNPIKDFETDDVHLTSKEVSLIENVILENDSLNKTRDLFLVGVYSGQRFSDYSVFDKSDLVEDVIIKRAEKTERKNMIPYHKKLKDILDKYDWKLPVISGQKFNPKLKQVCRLAGITQKVKKTNYKGNEKEVKIVEKCEMVSSHTARRTFITLSSERGVPDHIIMKVTGIKDPKTLLKYKKTNSKIVSDFIRQAWQ